tara:strand:+ start:34035 stop:34964 length:930 start_codon:yes stop_codon:yes gene_type:complete
MAGVLGHPVDNQEFQVDSKTLRAFSEHILDSLQSREQDLPQAESVADLITLNIAKAFSLTTLNEAASNKEPTETDSIFTTSAITPSLQEQAREEVIQQSVSKQEHTAQTHNDAGQIKRETAQKRKQTPPMVFRQELSQEKMPEIQSVVVQKKSLTLKELESQLKDTQLGEQLSIKSVHVQHSSHCLEVEFEKEEDTSEQEKQTFKGYINELPKTNDEESASMMYSIEKNIDQSLKETAIKHMCDLAVATAKPNAEFDLKNTDQKQKEIVFKMLTQAIEKGISDNIFDIESAPKIIGYDSHKKRSALSRH